MFRTGGNKSSLQREKRRDREMYADSREATDERQKGGRP
jgi:hypothetical protein